MHISDLSQASGVPVATIKFYLREGLLPAGTVGVRRRIDYSEAHLARLRLARSLVLIGQLSIATVRQLSEAVDGGGLSPRDIRPLVSRAVHAGPASAAEFDDAGLGRAHVDELLDRLGWQVGEHVPGRLSLMRTFAALRQLGCEGGVVDALVPFGDCLRRLVGQDSSLPAGDPMAAVARMVLFEVAIVALLRLVHEHGPASTAVLSPAGRAEVQ